MRKYIIGFVVGVLLTFAASVHAEDISKIGQRIDAEFAVMLNGEELPVKAIALEGTSYAPIRATAEALGLEVGFVDGVVALTSDQNRQEGDGAIEEIQKIEGQLRVIEKDIEIAEKRVRNYKEALQSTINQKAHFDNSDEIIQKREAELQRKQAELADLLRQKAELESQLQQLIK